MVGSSILIFLDNLLFASVHGQAFVWLPRRRTIFTVFVCHRALKRSCADRGLQSHLNADNHDGITANCPLETLRVSLCPCHESGRGCEHRVMLLGERECRCTTPPGTLILIPCWQSCVLLVLVLLADAELENEI